MVASSGVSEYRDINSIKVIQVPDYLRMPLTTLQIYKQTGHDLPLLYFSVSHWISDVTEQSKLCETRREMRTKNARNVEVMV
jgi:hypothetical protein